MSLSPFDGVLLDDAREPIPGALAVLLHLQVGRQDRDPPRLRALMAMPQLGAVSFRLATARGAGRRGLFGDPEPHLVRDLLPSFEKACADRGIEHFELETPPGWGLNPWGDALD